MPLKLYQVSFTRMGNEIPKPFQYTFEAPSINALEGPIQSFVDDYLGENSDAHQVTIIPENKTGQIGYGLYGNFTIEGD